jgi:hypothetical protein
MLKSGASQGVSLYLLDLQNQYSRSGIPNASNGGSGGETKLIGDSQ